jgi:beta-lactamase regulating signal transducer with metallopeptidase domain
VLQHELAHIARWDYLTQWVALLSCAIHWANPLVWKLSKLLSETREEACDDKVLALGTKSSDYANSLLEISQVIRRKWARYPGTLAMVEYSNLAKRIRRILDKSQKRHTLTHRKRVIWLMLMTLVLMPLSTIQFSPIAAQSNVITLTASIPVWKTGKHPIGQVNMTRRKSSASLKAPIPA